MSLPTFERSTFYRSGREAPSNEGADRIPRFIHVQSVPLYIPNTPSAWAYDGILASIDPCTPLKSTTPQLQSSSLMRRVAPVSTDGKGAGTAAVPPSQGARQASASKSCSKTPGAKAVPVETAERASLFRVVSDACVS